MSEELKPCPFCRGQAAIERSFSGGPFSLCGKCGAATMFSRTKAEAIALWNTRTDAKDALGWQDIGTAPKDGRYILALYRSLDGYAAHMDGRAFVVRHEGTSHGYDLGWALFPGFGGVPDKSLSHWRPLPTPPHTGGEQ